MESRKNLLELLEYIDPAGLGYQEWVNIGMALKQEGYSVSDWDAWSRRDSARYHRGECKKKWESFNGTSTPVTGGTIVLMAMERTGPGVETQERRPRTGLGGYNLERGRRRNRQGLDRRKRDKTAGR